MVPVLRIVNGLIALFFVVSGLRFMATPDVMALEFGLTPIGAVGLSTVRGDLGGIFLAIGALVAFGLWRRTAQALLAAALLIGAVAVGRTVGFVLDGITGTTAVSFAVEIVFVALLVAGARLLPRL